MNKKIIYIISLIIFVTISYVIVGLLQLKKNTITTNATPSTQKVIVLDAGHGKPDEGAVGLYGTTEEAINLEITLNLQRLLEQSGSKVILTRSDENGIYTTNSEKIKDKKISDIKNRVEIGNTDGVDIFVSIHLNKYSDSVYSGWQTFYQKNNEESQKLATCIQEGLNKEITETINNRTPLPLSDIYIMEHVKAPTVTVECGFLSNEKEVKQLQDTEYKKRLAWGIFMGIQEYFK